uniref:uncharacterized protein LOC120825485 isoform X3 n=1 Tax=Gasterosteus aculeatus aculeatus TaxID=481459 RepID=UPI001A981588|nr:uncharacterized protein LOC120825485 isoform X3 [Gasterosteus aculeatus aculeatus]
MIPTHSFTHSLTFTMMKIYVYFCLLSGLSVVQMKPLNINGHVGESVTISCSDWNVWTDVTENVKYFCYSPCTEDHHIIIKAAYEKIENKNGIKLYNQGKTLFVAFSNLQKSDSKTYYCRVERFGADAYIEVNLKVTDAPSPSPSMTPQTVIVVPTSSFTKSSTMSSNSSDVITDTSTSYTTLNTPPAAPAQGSVKVVSGAVTANRETQQDAGYEEIRLVDQTDPDALYSNYSYHQVKDLPVERRDGYSDTLYLNQAAIFMDNSRGACRKSAGTFDSVYSVVQHPKEQMNPSVQCKRNQPESAKENSLYSLAQRPQATRKMPKN